MPDMQSKPLHFVSDKFSSFILATNVFFSSPRDSFSDAFMTHVKFLAIIKKVSPLTVQHKASPSKYLVTIILI